MTEQNTLESLIIENNSLYALLEANQMLSSSLESSLILDVLMDKAREVLKAEASSLMLLDEQTEELYFHTIKGDNSDSLKNIHLKLGEGIAGWVAQNNKPVLVEDCQSDYRFSKKADKGSGFETRTMMCVPLHVKNRVIGTVQVLNKENNEQFGPRDQKIFQMLANQAAIAIDNARLHELATVDGMTGLYLKNYFMARMKESYKRVLSRGGDMSLLMSDIDHFKKVNDNYGHQGGDTALIELAHIIKDTVQGLNSDDIAGRYGGEEFCVLLPDSGPARAMEIAEMIRKNILNHPIPIDNQQAKITISIGIASFSLHSAYIKSEDDFIKLADEALYICKDKGRNCCALYEKPGP